MTTPVHDHGPEDGPGLNCNEHRDPTGRLVGNCLSAGNERVLHVDLCDILGPVGVAELIVKAAAEEDRP